jgi:hypothetical protein
MLRDTSWLAIAERRETLCMRCMLARSIERGIGIVYSDLKPCPFNLMGDPIWYDLLHDHAAGLARRNAGGWYLRSAPPGR